MARVQLRTDADVLLSLLTKVVARTDLNDITDSSVIKQILRAFATEFGEGYYQLFNVSNLHRIGQVRGDDVDRLAQEIVPGFLRRLAARRAIGSIIFSRPVTGSTVFAPAGSIVATSTGIRFSTLEQAEISIANFDSGAVAAIAMDPGVIGNVAVSTVTRLMNRPAGITSVTNVTSFVGGRDIESDDEFQSRLKTYVGSLSRCTPEALEALTLNLVDNATGKSVVTNKVFEDPVDRGDVTLFIDDGNGTARDANSISNGSVDNITAASPTNVILTSSGADFASWMTGLYISVSGAALASLQNGFFGPITFINTAQVTYANAAGLVEPFGTSALWSLFAQVIATGPGGAAVGGEEYLYINSRYRPVDYDQPWKVSSTTRGILTNGTDVRLNPTSGLLFFDPALAAGELIYTQHVFFTNLIAAVQRVVDGDSNNRLNFPGIRAAGVIVRVKAPTVRLIDVECTPVILDGYNTTAVKNEVRNAIITYINTLAISGDVIRHELVQRIMEVPGLYNVLLPTPATDVILNDDEVAKTVSILVLVN